MYLVKVSGVRLFSCGENDVLPEYIEIRGIVVSEDYREELKA